MTYEAARAQVVAMLQALTASTSAGGAPPRFREHEGADEGNPPAIRAFTLFGLSDDVRIPLIARSQRHRIARMELSVFYRRMADRKALDLMLRADHKVIGDRLIDPAQWNSASSGIVSIEQAGGTLILHADVEQRADGLIVHVYRFDLEYRSGGT